MKTRFDICCAIMLSLSAVVVAFIVSAIYIHDLAYWSLIPLAVAWTATLYGEHCRKEMIGAGYDRIALERLEHLRD